MFLRNFVLILQIVLNIKQIIAIINNENVHASFKQLNNRNYKTLQTGTFYLNHQSPLWVLQDAEPPKHITKQHSHQNYRKSNFDHIKPIYYRNTLRPGITNQPNYREAINADKRKAFPNNKSFVQLPHSYIESYSSKRKSYMPAFKNMPTFDSLPGDGSFDETKPLFIYTGHKGRMLFNTMLSTYKYPMQEPVPGETLYPPQTYTMATPKESLPPYTTFNVTMIPFYAYEAIDPRTINQHSIESQPLSSTPRTTKLKKLKKYKQYSAFYTPHEVFVEQNYDFTTAKPMTLGHHNIFNQENYESTTPLTLTLEKPHANHRQAISDATTSLPHKKLEVSFNDGEDKFRITYEDEKSATSLEKPTEVSTVQTRTYDSNGAESNHYNLPNYAAKHKTKNNEIIKIDNENVYSKESRANEITKTIPQRGGDNESTWIILNARYKGPLKSRHKNAHSSKYVQSTRTTEDYLDLDFLGTTGTTIKSINKKKKKLKPQMRSLVW